MPPIARVFAGICIVAIAFGAKADCAMMSKPEPFVTTIKTAYAPVYDGSGMRQPGCIVKTANGQTGYVSYDYICKLSSSEFIELRSDYGCCDSGPDSGDLTCTVRVNRLAGLDKIWAGGLGLTPTKPDVRGIADLLNTLNGEFSVREHGAALKLVDYAKNPSYEKETAAIRPELQDIVNNKQLHVDKRGYAAYVLINYPNTNDEEFSKFFVPFLEMEPMFEQIVIPQLQRAAALRKQADIFVPQLVYYLKRHYYSEAIASEILTTLEKLAPVLRPQLPKLLEFEYEWSDRGAYFDFKQRNEYWERMQRIACAISAQDTNQLPREYRPEGFKQKFKCS